MIQADPRIKRAIRRDKRTPEYASTAYEELVRLKFYYEDEIKQINVEIVRVEPGSSISAQLHGAKVAYRDHIDEISYVMELIRGLHLEENDKRSKTL